MRFLMLSWRDSHNPKSGGAERVSQAYLKALVDRGHQAFWFANQFPGGLSEESIDGVTIVRGGAVGSSIREAIKWYRRQQRFDLVIDQHHGIPWLAPWWSKTNSIAYIHEVLGPIWNSFYRWPFNLIGRWQETWTHWLYRRVPFWVPSESTKRALHRHGVRQVTVIPNGTDTTPLPFLEPKSLSAPVKLVAVSRLAPNKRVDHVIAATQALLQRRIQARLTIMGTGDVEADLRAMANQPELAGRVAFTGQVTEELKNLQLREAHLLIHTSVREGWGLNVIEANAMGTPAVVYPVAGLVDSTLHRETGLVTQTETPAAVAEGVIELLQNPAEYARLRLNAWNRAKTFQWPQVLQVASDWLEKQAMKARR